MYGKIELMRHIFLLTTLFFLLTLPAFAVQGLKQIYQDPKTGQTVYYESDPNYDIQIRYLDYNPETKTLKLSGLFTNLGPSISPDEHVGGKVRRIQINAVWLDSRGKVLARQELLPVDYYYQQPGFIRSGNQISVIFSAKNLEINLVERCVLSVVLVESDR